MGASPSLGGRRVELRLRQSFLSCSFLLLLLTGIKEVESRHLSFHRSARAVTSGVDLRFGFLVQRGFRERDLRIYVILFGSARCSEFLCTVCLC